MPDKFAIPNTTILYGDLYRAMDALSNRGMASDKEAFIRLCRALRPLNPPPSAKYFGFDLMKGTT